MVKRALKGLKGVQRADVSFRDKEARVTFEPTQVTQGDLVRFALLELAGAGLEP